MQLSQTQLRLIQDDSRFKVACWARRVGKSYACMVELMLKAQKLAPGSQMAILSQTNDSVRKIWLPLFKQIMPQNVKDTWTQPARVLLKNGVEIHITGANSKDSIDNLRGLALSHCIIDEGAFIPELEYAVNAVVMPTLATTKGSLTVISSPNGDNYFKELYDMGRSKDYPAWAAHHADYTKAFIDVSDLVDMQRKTMDPVTFNSEWMASFEGSGRNVYYAFDRAKHVDAEILDFHPGELVRVGIDFNIGINATVVFADRGGILYVIDEITGCNNTYDLCEEIRGRYGNHRIISYPDPAGAQRKTSAAAGTTDISIIRQSGIDAYHRKSTTSIKDGVNAVNALLANDRMFIHPRCGNLIQSLQRLSYKETSSSNIRYANEDYSHICDALRYATDYLYPVTKRKITRDNRAVGF